MNQIYNPANKMKLVFLQTGKETSGKLLEMEAHYTSNSAEPPAHYHLYQKETFTVVKGAMKVRIHNQLKTFKAGETFEVEPNTVHSMWNHTGETSVVNWKIEPALRTETFFRNLFGLATDGKTDNKGVPGIFQAALIADKFSNEMRLAKPPYLVQKIIIKILSAIGKIRGLKASYPQYEL